MEKTISNIKTLIILCLITMMIIGYCSTKIKHRQDLKKVNTSYESVLQDTLVKRDTVWLTKISTLTPEEIKESPVYKQLNDEKKALISELEKNKNLLASANVHVIATRERIEQLQDTIFWLKDSLFQAKDGTILTFTDTTGDFQYTENLTLSDTVTRETKYSLTINPDFRITKLNNYSVEGTWSFPGLDQEFDNITVRNGFHYYGTISEKERKKKNMLKILKITGLSLSHGLIAYGAFRLGSL